jgi:hypothetical protein
MTAFEVWDIRTGNLVASFGRKQQALALVRDAVASHGPPYARGLALVREDGDGNTVTVATGDRLLKRVWFRVHV